MIRSAARSRTRSSSRSKGLVRKSSAPASIPSTRSSFWARAVSRMVTTYPVRWDPRMRRMSSSPSSPGIIQSVMTIGVSPASNNCHASAPSWAAVTSYPHFWR